MKVAASLLTWTAVSGIVLACGGSSSDVANGPVTDQTLEAIASSFCDRIASCYGDTFVKAFLGDSATCKARLQIEVKLSSKGPGVQLADADAQLCKAAVDVAGCDALIDEGIAQCEFKGTLADGAACANDLQCTSGACFVDEKTDCGKCGPRAAEGADCTSAKCLRGLTCNGANKCVKRVAAGGTCDENTPCVVPLSCIAGKCGKGLAKDAACKNGKDETPCDTASGLFCKPPAATNPDGTCTPFTVASAGKACGVTLQPTIDFAFCENSQCVGASGTTPGICQAYLADGVACGETTPDCQFPAKCRNGKCATLDPTACK